MIDNNCEIYVIKISLETIKNSYLVIKGINNIAYGYIYDLLIKARLMKMHKTTKKLS